MIMRLSCHWRASQLCRSWSKRLNDIVRSNRFFKLEKYIHVITYTKYVLRAFCISCSCLMKTVLKRLYCLKKIKRPVLWGTLCTSLSLQKTQYALSSFRLEQTNDNLWYPFTNKQIDCLICYYFRKLLIYLILLMVKVFRIVVISTCGWLSQVCFCIWTSCGGVSSVTHRQCRLECNAHIFSHWTI